MAKRFKVNKKRSARQFRKQSRRTAKANVRSQPLRGGWRL